MPLINAEKQKRYRQRLIEKHEADAIKNKDKARKKQKRKENLTVSREKETIRQQKYRASKAGKISKSPTYKSKTTIPRQSNEHQKHCQNHLGNDQWLSKSFCFKPTWQNMQNPCLEQGGEVSLLR